jgi:hypothetical protein
MSTVNDTNSARRDACQAALQDCLAACGQPAAGPAPTRPETPAPLVPGTWRGTLAFLGTVTPISIQFADDASLALTSPRGVVASGSWSRQADGSILVDARHQQLGDFKCDLKAAAATIAGRCTANGKHAGDITLAGRGPLNR